MSEINYFWIFLNFTHFVWNSGYSPLFWFYYVNQLWWQWGELSNFRETMLIFTKIWTRMTKLSINLYWSISVGVPSQTLFYYYNIYLFSIPFNLMYSMIYICCKIPKKLFKMAHISCRHFKLFELLFNDSHEDTPLNLNNINFDVFECI